MQIALIMLSYLIGSVPFGMLFARAKGINLRETGSRNIGATNVLRSVGKGAALLTLMGDLLKGAAAVALGKALAVGPLYEGLMGLAAVAGHDFSAFLRLRGGKGVATSLGVILIYAPKAGILTVILWVAVVLATRYSSLGALLSFAVLPAGVALFGYPGEKVALSGIISIVLFVKHSDNIKRLLSGTERRVGEKT
jgi:glycerol-3-phosphate acyltransferase PlsY